MGKFSSTNQPEKRTPRGAGKRTTAFKQQGQKLLSQLMEQALNGDIEAARLVLPFIPKPKAYTEPDTIDAQLIEARIFELTELEQRLQALEQAAKHD